MRSSGVESEDEAAISNLVSSWAPYLILLSLCCLCSYFSVVIDLPLDDRSNMDTVFVPGALGLIEELDSEYEVPS